MLPSRRGEGVVLTHQILTATLWGAAAMENENRVCESTWYLVDSQKIPVYPIIFKPYRNKLIYKT